MATDSDKKKRWTVWRHCKGFAWQRVNWDPIEGWWYRCAGCGIGATEDTIWRKA